MRRERTSGQFLSAVFVDYDNIYLSLKRKSEEAAKRFAKDAAVWLKAIETGSLITPTNAPLAAGGRRIVMNRCYGNPVPRRNQADNSTDMNSFPFVRHHFLRSGFEIIDCPPLTAQLKNSSDIRMVMDVRDFLTHETYFDEFVILSGDADFTPVLHRLRAHARQTVIYANDYTAAPYTAISDGEIRESDLIAILLDGRIAAETAQVEPVGRSDMAYIEAARRDILADVAATVRASAAPVPLEVLADRAIRNIGHDRTVGTSWGGAGGFRELLAQGLPDGMRVSGEPPYVVIDSSRHLAQPSPTPSLTPSHSHAEQRADRLLAQPAPPAPSLQPSPSQAAPMPAAPTAQPSRDPFFARQPDIAYPQPPIAPPARRAAPAASLQGPLGQQPGAAPAAPIRTRAPELQAPVQPAGASRPADSQSQLQQSIARIHEACQAPPLAPPEYRLLFECMAQELNENGLNGAQTIQNITQRAQSRGVDVRRDDVRFILEVVSEADPWFEQGASANLFAGRFRNFVVARCRSQGLNLSADELDLIEAWFAGGTAPAPAQTSPQAQSRLSAGQVGEQPSSHTAPRPPASDPRSGWSLEEGRQHVAGDRAGQRQPPQPSESATDDFPRIVRTRLRG